MILHRLFQRGGRQFSRPSAVSMPPARSRWLGTPLKFSTESRGLNIASFAHKQSCTEGATKLKDILVFLDADPTGDGRLSLAVDIARGQGAYIDAVFLYSCRPAA